MPLRNSFKEYPRNPPGVKWKAKKIRVLELRTLKRLSMEKNEDTNDDGGPALNVISQRRQLIPKQTKELASNL